MIIPWVFCGFYGSMRILTLKPEKKMKEFFGTVVAAHPDPARARRCEPQQLAKFQRCHWINSRF